MRRIYLLGVLLTTSLAQAATAALTSNANLRRSPSSSGEVLAIIPRGTVLTMACTGSWCRTTYKGRSGYVAQSLVRLQSGTTSLAAPTMAAQRAEVYYANCAAARAAGAAPLYRGQSGYRLPLDRDHDGVACE